MYRSTTNPCSSSTAASRCRAASVRWRCTSRQAADGTDEGPAPRARAKSSSNGPVPPRVEEAGGSKLIVVPNIKLKGVEIDDCDPLVVEGRVEATMVSRAIQIAETGAFSGKVDVDVAEIRGSFQGEMTARKKLVIHASGRVSGKIRYGKMLVQEGGEMSGDIGALAEGTAQFPK